MRLRKILFLSLSIWLLLAVASGRAQTPHPSVYQLKAAFIYNFAKFVDWPPSAFADQESPFVIGILGDNPFGSKFGEMVAGKKIDEHPISVQTFHTVTEAGHCQILFVSSSEKKKLSRDYPAFAGDAGSYRG